MRPASTSSSNSSLSLAFSDYDDEDDIRAFNNNNSSQQFFAKLVRDTRSKVEQKTSEINATMQEKLPEWKSRGVMYSNKAKEASIEWSRKGKEAVDRWKKDRSETQSLSHRPIQRPIENLVFGMPLEVAIAMTKIEQDDLVPGVFKRCIDYLNLVGVHEVGIYRISGSTLTVNKLRDEFNNVPENIIPSEYTQEFDIIWSQEETGSNQLQFISPNVIRAVRSIMAKLSLCNFCLLQQLCQHLKRVSDNEKETKMSVSNLALIFIPTLNIERALFHCMVEHYYNVFENGTRKKPAGPVNVPPPLPQKPRNLLMEVKSTSAITNSPKKVAHSKTMSDTGMYVSSIKDSFLSPNTSKTPPPKPSRSPQSSSSNASEFKKPPRQPPPLPPSKPRSKSVSSPVRNNTIFSPTPNLETDLEEPIWKQRGRLNIANPATGCQKLIEIEDERRLRGFYDKRMAQEVSGDTLGDEFKGYVFRITGGNDKQGFPMKQGVLLPHRVRLLMSKGHSCYRPRRTGERKRKSVRGCIVGSDLSVLSLVVVKQGEQDIPGLTDTTVPKRLGPKRASKIRRFFVSSVCVLCVFWN
ncbi:hypothetical protein G6F43_012156 [Rhizopus delemar]|nr:hypothetical protein G6F43_012156 [Rhizopus delemar]